MRMKQFLFATTAAIALALTVGCTSTTEILETPDGEQIALLTIQADERIIRKNLSATVCTKHRWKLADPFDPDADPVELNLHVTRFDGECAEIVFVCPDGTKNVRDFCVGKTVDTGCKTTSGHPLQVRIETL